MIDTKTQEVDTAEHIKELISKSEKVSFFAAREFRDSQDVNLGLDRLMLSWKQTLVPKSKGTDGLIVRLDDDQSIVLPGDTPTNVIASQAKPQHLMIPIRDNLVIIQSERSFTLNIEDYPKGGSQVVLHNTNKDDLDIKTIDPEQIKLSNSLQKMGLYPLAEFKTIENVSHTKIVGLQLNRENIDAKSQFIKIMETTDTFRVDSIKGGLMRATCWGPVEFKMGS